MKKDALLSCAVAIIFGVLFSGCDLLGGDKDKAGGEAQIVAFSLSGMIGTAAIDSEAHTVTVTAEPMDLSGVTPTIEVSEGATVTTAAFVDGEAVTFKVTAEDGTVVSWTVTVNVQHGVSFNYESTPTRVVLTKGFVDSEDEEHNAVIGNGQPFGVYSTVEELAMIFVLADEVDVADVEPSEFEYAELYFPGATGTYDSTGILFGYIYLTATEDFGFTNDPNTAENFALIVTSYGNVGEDMTGTFSGTVSNGTTHTITDGFFKVKRLEDDTYWY